jgi:hypothetical protein
MSPKNNKGMMQKFSLGGKEFEYYGVAQADVKKYLLELNRATSGQKKLETQTRKTTKTQKNQGV